MQITAAAAEEEDKDRAAAAAEEEDKNKVEAAVEEEDKDAAAAEEAKTITNPLLKAEFAAVSE
jgi:hypothetical protein